VSIPDQDADCSGDRGDNGRQQRRDEVQVHVGVPFAEFMVGE
jgi:hypothetical protein